MPCLSTVLSGELRSVHIAIELLCLREHLWELSNTSISSSVVDEIDDLLYFVVNPTHMIFSATSKSAIFVFLLICWLACLFV